jgi:predicted ATPase
MLERIQIENYKSIQQLSVDVARFNVLIGENGAGKSNFLEALAVFGAVEADKFDHEFLVSRGIRMVDADLMFSQFDDSVEKIEILIKNQMDSITTCASIYKDENFFNFLKSSLSVSDKNGDEIVINDLKYDSEKISNLITELHNEHVKYRKLMSDYNSFDVESMSYISNVLREHRYIFIKMVLDRMVNRAGGGADFIVYAPENSALRNLEKEGQIQPLGVNGEGLYKLLQVMQRDEPDAFKDVMDCLSVFDWIELDDDDQCAVTINHQENEMAQKIKIKDQYLIVELDQRSANEGFLFVLFYAALFCSKYTPKIFAIDNIDASLNPRLCQKLTSKLVELAKKYDKQVFVTTHNPAILDGLDLHDPEQALFVVSRNGQGCTKLKRLTVENLPSALTEGEDINRLSEAFIRGYLGGLPTNF